MWLHSFYLFLFQHWVYFDQPINIVIEYVLELWFLNQMWISKNNTFWRIWKFGKFRIRYWHCVNPISYGILSRWVLWNNIRSNFSELSWKKDIEIRFIRFIPSNVVNSHLGGPLPQILMWRESSHCRCWSLWRHCLCPWMPAF